MAFKTWYLEVVCLSTSSLLNKFDKAESLCATSKGIFNLRENLFLHFRMDLKIYTNMALKSTSVHRYISLLLILLVSSGDTFSQGKLPLIKVTGTNTNTVKKYEKFEVSLVLENVEVENPFDPEDIDVYAQFFAPSGKKIPTILFMMMEHTGSFGMIPGAEIY